MYPYRLCCACHRIESLRQLAEDGISTATCDVCSPASIAACVSDIVKQAGSIDILINNAGTPLRPSPPLFLP